ncbi:MAG: TIGR04013 family B12-binding domain/radical SAM domain-containing protein [Candidatus Njordarchaeales archaeon]
MRTGGSKYRFIFYYSRFNKFALNAVIASVESGRILEEIVIVRNREELLERVAQFSQSAYIPVVCLSFMTPQLPDVMELSGTIKKICPNALLVAGGPHASGDPAGTLLNLRFDIVFIGEAEQSFREFFERMRNGEDFLGVRGIAYNYYGELIYTGTPKRIDLNDYPPFPYWRNLLGPIEITRGCSWLCTYCQVPYMHGAFLRHRSVDKILYYAEKFFKQGGRDLRFISPNSLSYGGLGEEINLNALETLLSRLYILAKHYNGRIFMGSFPSEVRPDFVTEDALRILRGKVANKVLIIGAQSGSEKVLKLIRRGHDTNCVLRAVELCRKYGFIPHVDFIFGLPGEDREDLMDSLRLAKRLIEMGARIHAHTFMPLPGTPLENAPPGKIPEWLKKELSRMTGRGKLYGNWVKQEKIAWMIYNYIKRGIILGKKGWKLLRNA